MSRILFDHIAIAMARMADAPAVLVGDLGGAPHIGGLSGAYRWGQWSFAGGGRLEVIEPSEADGFLRRFLARHGPGIHHVTFKVPSVRAVCQRAEAHGYAIVGFDDSDPEWAEAFLHPQQALGLVVQLAESRSEAAEERQRGWQAPPGPPHPPPPVTILGLRTRAHSRERARTQWEAILHGEGAEGAGRELIFRWPGSPMRLVVEIDASREEGPIGIEYAGDRPPMPDGPHPVLGAVFARGAAT